MRTLIRVQALSGLIFAVFLVLHLATTVAAVGGPEAYDSVLLTLRQIYSPHPFVEIALMGVSGTVHVACALWRIARRLRLPPREREPMRIRLHRYSGYVLLLAAGGHAVATRIAPSLSTVPTATGRADFSYLAFSLLNWPAFMIPYYLLFGVAGAVHLTLGLGLALRILVPPLVRTEPMRRVSVAAAAILAVAVAAGVGAMAMQASSASRARFPEFAALYDEYAPFIHPKVRDATSGETNP